MEPKTSDAAGATWLLLVHQLPAHPSRARVKAWRRLQEVGAVALRNSVYLLPNTEQTREDLEWIKGEILAMKGQASLFLASSLDSITRDEIIEAFRSARAPDFAELKRKGEAAAAQWERSRHPARKNIAPFEKTLRSLTERCADIEAIDFFGAPGREPARAALRRLEEMLQQNRSRKSSTETASARLEEYQGRLWVTRPRPGIDRMASAWLIRRFIDPRARFGFVTSAPASRGVPFDMYGVEFTHQGNLCTFELLAQRFDVSSPPVARLGHVVHDLDLKDERYAAPEAPAVGRLVEGLRQMYSEDRELLERGMDMIEALYRSYADEGAGPRRTVRRRRAASRKK